MLHFNISTNTNFIYIFLYNNSTHNLEFDVNLKINNFANS